MKSALTLFFAFLPEMIKCHHPEKHITPPPPLLQPTPPTHVPIKMQQQSFTLCDCEMNEMLKEHYSP